MQNRKVILYISMSLDGFIASQDDDLSFLSIVQKEGEDYGYSDFTANVDTYIVGRKTYDKIIELIGTFPQAKEYNCYVITRQHMENQPNITFYNGNIKQLIQELKHQPGKNIYCDGGGEIVKLLMDQNLIDEYRISIIPTILGDGKRLFLGSINSRPLELISSHQYDTGLVQLSYRNVL